MTGRFLIVEQAEYYIRYVSSVVPEAQAAHRGDVRWPVCANDEVNGREEMHEQVACYACAVVPVVPPTEEANRIEGSLRGAPKKAIPVNPLRRCIGRE